jgi:hypothetical protein
MLRPSASRVLHTVCKSAVAQAAQAIQSERRAGPVSTQALATKIVVLLNSCWSRSGSWQGHTIPYANKGSCGVNFILTNKYWGMGGRCAR